MHCKECWEKPLASGTEHVYIHFILRRQFFSVSMMDCGGKLPWGESQARHNNCVALDSQATSLVLSFLFIRYLVRIK